MPKLSSFFWGANVVLGIIIILTLAAPAHAGVQCTSYATKKCISNISYWHDSCGVLQTIAQNCNFTNQICQNGQCVNKAPQPSPGQNLGVICKDYCKTVSQDQPQAKNLVISIFAKKQSDPLQWQKYVSAGNNENLDFLLVVKNISNSPADNVSVKADITNNIAYTGSLKIDDAPSTGNVVSGISLGTIPPNTSKSVTFSGATQAAGAQNIQITSTAGTDSTADSDSLTVNVAPPGQDSIDTGAGAKAYPIVEFIKRWYVWIIIIGVLITLFVIIFRRLSSNV